MPTRAVFLDRDGTVIRERHYLSDPAGVELLPHAAEGLRRLQTLGFALAIVTNQSGVGRGLYDEARLRQIHERMQNLLRSEGVRLAAIYFCPHTPEDACACRKPATGLLERARAELGCAFADSFVIGDKPCDIELGRNAGTRTILVRTGYGGDLDPAAVRADFVAADLGEAARLIEQNSPLGPPPPAATI